MFVSDLATLDVSFEVALARLAALTGSGALTRVSADAYAAGTSSGMRLLARSRFRDLITRPGRRGARRQVGDQRPRRRAVSPCSTPTSP